MTMITESQGAARPLATTGFFAAVVSYLASFRRSRRALQDISAMEDYMLRDIGLIMSARIADFGADRMAMLDVARSRGLRH